MLFYFTFAAALGWAGHLLVRRWNYPSASPMRRRLFLVISSALLLAGLWFTNIVAFSVWAGGGPDTAYKDAHLLRASWALASAAASFLAAGATWPRKVGQ